MTADTDQPTLAVTQAVRDVAAEFELMIGRINPMDAANIRAGEWDATKDVQWFASLMARTHSEPRPAGLREALEEAREMLLEMSHARSCEYEGTDEELVGFIDVALASPDPTSLEGGEGVLRQALERIANSERSAGIYDTLGNAALARQTLATHSPAPMAGELAGYLTYDEEGGDEEFMREPLGEADFEAGCTQRPVYFAAHPSTQGV